MSTLQRALKCSGELSDRLLAALHEQGIAEHRRRERITLVFVSLALDHRAAVELLVAHGAYATAMAVTRPILEAYVRGLWAFHLATEEELANFVNSRYDPTIDSSLRRLKQLAKPNGQIFEILRSHYRTLCDYAHGGSRQVSRWLHGNEIEPQYSDEQMAETLHFVDLVGVLASAAREKLMGYPIDAFSAELSRLLATDYRTGCAQS